MLLTLLLMLVLVGIGLYMAVADSVSSLISLQPEVTVSPLPRVNGARTVQPVSNPVVTIQQPSTGLFAPEVSSVPGPSQAY